MITSIVGRLCDRPNIGNSLSLSGVYIYRVDMCVSVCLCVFVCDVHCTRYRLSEFHWTMKCHRFELMNLNGNSRSMWTREQFEKCARRIRNSRFENTCQERVKIVIQWVDVSDIIQHPTSIDHSIKRDSSSSSSFSLTTDAWRNKVNIFFAVVNIDEQMIRGSFCQFDRIEWTCWR